MSETEKKNAIETEGTVEETAKTTLLEKAKANKKKILLGLGVLGIGALGVMAIRNRPKWHNLDEEYDVEHLTEGEEEA